MDSSFKCNFDKHAGRTATAKRLRLKAQGCFNPGVVSADHYQPGTGCANGRNRIAVEWAIQFCKATEVFSSVVLHFKFEFTNINRKMTTNRL